MDSPSTHPFMHRTGSVTKQIHGGMLCRTWVHFRLGGTEGICELGRSQPCDEPTLLLLCRPRPPPRPPSLRPPEPCAQKDGSPTLPAHLSRNLTPLVIANSIAHCSPPVYSGVEEGCGGPRRLGLCPPPLLRGSCHRATLCPPSHSRHRPASQTPAPLTYDLVGHWQPPVPLVLQDGLRVL